MKLLNRLSRVTCWLILVLLVQTTAAPALADPPPGGDLPLNVIDPPISVPPMAYQPPPDANELSDFVPPNAVVLEIPIDLPGGPITPTVEPTPTVFPTQDPPGSATPESTTLPTEEPLTSSTTESTTFTLPEVTPPIFPTAEPTISVTPEQPTAEPTATTTSEPPSTLTPEVTLTPPFTSTQPVSVTIDLNGTLTHVVSFDQGQVAVVIEENTISPTAQLEFTFIPAAVPPITIPITATNTLSNLVGTQNLIQFQLEVIQEGLPVDGFEKRVRIVLDLRSLTVDLNPVYAGNFFLAYQDENDPTLWHDVPITLHQEAGLLSAEVTHFSDWAAGVRPERWNPSWNPPSVATFSGAATYSYPIDIPPGRHGMQPAVGLSYSSRSLDGRIHNGEPGEVADGWSLSKIAIVREGVKVESPFGAPLIHHPDKFRLVMNGTGYEIYPESGVLTFDDDPELEIPSVGALVRWYAKDAPGLKIMRYYDATLPTDGLYWVVTTADGTQYRLGYTVDSEEYQEGTLWYEQETHRGDNTSAISAIAWNVDTVTDSFGNQMTYHYYTRTVTETIDWFNTDPNNPHWTTSTIETHTSRIATIKYNYNGRITTLPVTNTVIRLSDTLTAASRLEFRAATADTGGQFGNPINSIYVFHGSSTNPITEYRISSTDQSVTSPSCNYPPNQDVNNRTTRVVTAIQQFANTDSDPGTLDTGYYLPAVTFEYISKAHYLKNGTGECFSFRYLSQVQNGYGATTSFTYTSDSRSVGEYWKEVVLDGNGQFVMDLYHYPVFGFNYFVTSVTNNDGRNPSITTAYDYYKPCYGQWDSSSTYLPPDSGHTEDAITCPGPEAPQFGNLVGFGRTTQTHYDFNGTTILNKQVSYFFQDIDTVGRPERQEFYNESTLLLNCSKTSYTTLANNSTTFTHADEVNSYLFASGGDCAATPPTGATIQTKVNTDYDSYGNPSVVYHYGDTTTTADDRKITYTYYPNTTGGYWMVGQVAVQQEYEGITTSTLKRESRTYYDNTSSYTQPPTKGEVRQMTVGLASSFITTAQNTYDEYGNVATTTTPSGATTTFTYEGNYLYPIQIQTAASGLTTRTTQFQIYGFNGVTVDGLHTPTGQLKQVTDVNNSLTTLYDYDPFGRLFAVYNPGDNRGDASDAWDGNPGTRYRYWDNLWNGSLASPFAITVQTLPATYPDPPVSTPYTLDVLIYYDGFGRVFQERQRYVNVISTYRDVIVASEYNALGQVRCTTTPFDVPTTPAQMDYTTCETTGITETSTTYDAQARPLVVTAPDNTTTSYSYSLTTNVQVGAINPFTTLQRTQVTDANGHMTQNFTNAGNQLMLVREMAGTGGGATPEADTRYTYDWAGNLKEVITTDDINSHPTINILRQVTMEYDTWGRKVTMNDPDMGTWLYTYDNSGNLLTQVDANGDKLCFTYDALGRLTYKREDTTPATNCPTSGSYLANYTYDTATNGVGQLASVSWGNDPASNYDTFVYDTLGRLSSQTRLLDGIPYTITTLTFDSLHRPLTVQYPDGEVVTLSYDHEGENSLTAGGTGLVDNIQYNVRGQMTLFDRASVVDTSYSYYAATDSAGGGTGDSNFRLQTLQHGGNDIWPNITYQYDKVGNITQMATTVTPSGTSYTENQTYTYDHRNRLDTALAPNFTEAGTTFPNYSYNYEYDLLGNIIGTNGSITYDYDTWNTTGCSNIPSHPMPQAVKQIGSSSYFCYDENGNMNKRVENSTTYDQEFDIENRLTSVITGNETTTFAYDASGQRVKTTHPDGTVIYTPFPSYEVEIKPDSWQDVSFTPNGYNTTDEPGWTMQNNDTPGYYFETPASLSWSSTRTFPGTTTLLGDRYELNNLATGSVQSSPISVTAGETYSLSAWVKGELNSATSPGQAQILVIYGQTITALWSASSYSNTTWQQVGGNFTIPPGVSSVTIKLSVGQINGWIAFDDLSLSDKNGAVTIPNNSFESGTWTESASASYPATAIWRGNSGPASPAHQGSYSYVLSNLGHSQLESPLFAVTPGTRTIAMWLKGVYDGASSGGQVRLEALYYDSHNQQIGTTQTVWSATTLSYASWQQVSNNSTAPSGTTQMRLRVVSEFNNLSLVVDDVTVAGVTVPDGAFETGNIWTVSHQAAFPASTIYYGLGGHGVSPNKAYTFNNTAYGEWQSAAITARPSQKYELSATLQGELNSAAGTGEAFLQVYSYDSGNNLLSGQTIWNSGSGYNGEGTAASGSFTTPANTATLKVGLLLKQANGWVAFDDVTLASYSQAIDSGTGQVYDLSAWVRGVVSASGGQLGGKIRVNFYNSGGSEVGTPVTLWSSSSYNQTSGNGQLQSGSFTTPSGTASFRVGLEIHVDNGWLDIDDLTLTGWSHTITSAANRTYDLSALVSGNVQTAAVGDGGRIRIRYTSTPPAGDTVLWNSPINYNSPGGTTQSGSFTTPTGTTSFKVGYEVRLDNGWLGFDVITLTGYSGSVTAAGDRTYELSALVSGEVSAPAVGEGGKLKVVFTPSGPGPATVWNSPISYNSSSGTLQTGQFTTPAGTTSFKVGYETRLDTGWLGFSAITLKQLSPGITTTRSLYSLTGQTVATRQKQENSLPYMADTFSDNNETGWTEHNGSWNTVAASPNGYAYQQTNTTQSATNASYNLTQDSPISYNWQMTFQSSNRKAGLYFFGSDAANNSYHGNSYRIWQNESQLQICEQTPNSSNCSASANLSAANGETHTYRATYNPANGQLSVWRDGVFALTWTDSTPLTGGNHIAFRTQNSSVRFDNIRATTTSSSLYYFFTDHLGSTSVLSDSSGNEVVGSRTRHLPFGGWRGTAPTQTVTDRAFTGQKENMEVGLLYYNARYYLPNTNRFISADTIVPNPQNPQSFNRYSYVRNSPLNRIDPTGHLDNCAALGDLNDIQGCENPPPDSLPPNNLITHLPIAKDPATGVDEIDWLGGFGANWFSQDPIDCCYDQSHNIHTGLDFGADVGTTVYATVSGTVYFGSEYAGDADTNLVIKVVVGDATFYVIHGHIDPETFTEGQYIEAGTVIGTVDEYKDGASHVHLGIRQKDSGGSGQDAGQDWAYNPLLFMAPELSAMLTIDNADKYYGNETPTSMVGFRYGTGSYFDAEARKNMEIIR